MRRHFYVLREYCEMSGIWFLSWLKVLIRVPILVCFFSDFGLYKVIQRAKCHFLVWNFGETMFKSSTGLPKF